MKNLQKITRCLISVSDKTKIIELAKFLAQKEVEIISTGGTYKLLKENQIKVKEISQFTNFPEIMDGRVKTLHPKVHGGLLGIVGNASHEKQAQENGIEAIDLLVVNLYPFVETVQKTSNAEEIIENIDIGGPAMVRSASKNFDCKTVITDVGAYDSLIDEINKNQGATSFEFRKKMAARAFKNIANYDLAISNWFETQENEGQNADFAPTINIQAQLKQQLRYGENSHQQAALYSLGNENGIVNAKQIQGKELSYNNLNDADAAYNLALEFENPACVIIKHANPCGAATAQNHLDAYKKALNADPKSAFGGIVAINGKIDETLAEELSQIFFEVIIAKEISDSAKEILAKKKNLRILIANFKESAAKEIKSISGGFLVQDSNNQKINKNLLKQATNAALKNNEIDQLIFAMSICKHVKSNAIVIVNDFQTVGIGAGQTSRVDSCEIACKKAKNFAISESVQDKAKGGFLASDAFFPFADNIEIAAAHGIKGIIAPSGSIRDEEVVALANKHGIALYFIENRHFKH